MVHDQGGYGAQLGATTVGLKSKEGVVLASEKRMSYGGFVMSRVGKKAYKINERFGIAFAGLPADMQALFKIMSTEIRYYELSVGKPISSRAAAKLLSTILYTYKLMPFFSEVLFGGRDNDKDFHLFVLDALGSLIEDDYAAIGSGAPIALGLIEDKYHEGMSIDEMVDLAVKSVKVALRRDALSGDGIDLVIISRKGVEERTIPLRA